MADSVRFQLLVKAGKDGCCVGDCPFSQRVCMLAKMRLPSSDLEITPVNTVDKPDFFLKLNPEGKVPVLIDRVADKVVPDSGEIANYFETLYPKPKTDAEATSEKSAADSISGVFSKFVQFIKNKDKDKEEALKKALETELQKIDTFLQQGATASGQYLVCGEMSEVDCQLLPKLKHIEVAGGHYKQFKIPSELNALQNYISLAESNAVFKSTCPAQEEIIWGWGKVVN